MPLAFWIAAGLFAAEDAEFEASFGAFWNADGDADLGEAGFDDIGPEEKLSNRNNAAPTLTIEANATLGRSEICEAPTATVLFPPGNAPNPLTLLMRRS